MCAILSHTGAVRRVGTASRRVLLAGADAREPARQRRGCSGSGAASRQRGDVHRAPIPRPSMRFETSATRGDLAGAGIDERVVSDGCRSPGPHPPSRAAGSVTAWSPTQPATTKNVRAYRFSLRASGRSPNNCARCRRRTDRAKNRPTAGRLDQPHRLYSRRAPPFPYDVGGRPEIAERAARGVPST